MTEGQSKVYDFACKVWDKDSAFREQAAYTKSVTRQRKEMTYSLGFGKSAKTYTVTPTARPWALVSMFAASPEATPRIEIPPVVTDEASDVKSSKIERWLKGVRGATKYGVHHPDDAAWLHYAETGRMILHVQFDLDAAKRGEFPFKRAAIDPEVFSFRASDNGIMCAVMKERRNALELYDELAGAYEAGYKAVGSKKDMEWGLPEVLTKAHDEYEDIDVELLQYWDKERWFMWVNGEVVWRYEGAEGRPHLIPDTCPFQVGFCNGFPSERSEEWGVGIVKPTLGQMTDNALMSHKMQQALEFFYFPLVKVKHNDGTITAPQMVPGADFGAALDAELMNPQANEALAAAARQQNDEEINRAALPESTFGAEDKQLSGYAYSITQSGPQRRVEKLLESGTDAYKAHYQLLLKCVETFTDPDYVGKLRLKEKEQDAYYRSFSTSTPTPNVPGKKTYSTVTLKASDVAGYCVVNLDFKPEAQDDANAKYQRAQLAKDTGLPMEEIVRDIINVDEPEKVLGWMKDEALMQNPKWQEFMTLKWMREKLDSDKKLTAEFQEYLDGVLEAGLSAPEPPPQDPNIMGQQMPQQPPGVDLAGQVPQGFDANGIPPEMMPPAAMGQAPVDPMQAAMQASFNGNGQGY